MAELNAKIEWTLILNASELNLIIHGLNVRIREEDKEEAKKLAIQLVNRKINSVDSFTKSNEKLKDNVVKASQS